MEDATTAGQSQSLVNNVNVNVGGPTIVVANKGRQLPFLIRAVWFCTIGFWLSAVFILLGYVFTASIILMPLGFWFLNRVPQAQTLRQRNTDMAVSQKDGVTYLTESTAEQHPWYLRLLYLPIGLILGGIWLTLAWFAGVLIITLPLSIWMIDRAPAVITLEKY